MRKRAPSVIAAACLALAGVLVQAASGEQIALAAGAIPDGGTLERSGEIAPGPPRTIASIRVRIVAIHPWVGDLRAILTAPDGSAVTLLDRPGIPSNGYPGPWGCGGDGLDVTLDDAGLSAAESTCPYGATPALAGVLRPLEPLASLRGRSPTGLWRIRIEDPVLGDAGALVGGAIEITTAPDCNRNGVDDAIDVATGTSSDANGDGVPDECACIADLDGDGLVGATDLAALLASWGSCTRCPPDLDADGEVAASDLAALLASWGLCADS